MEKPFCAFRELVDLSSLASRGVRWLEGYPGHFLVSSLIGLVFASSLELMVTNAIMGNNPRLRMHFYLVGIRESSGVQALEPLVLQMTKSKMQLFNI